MFGAIRHVISEPDDVGHHQNANAGSAAEQPPPQQVGVPGGSPEQQQQQQEPPQAVVPPGGSPEHATTTSRNLIEPEDNDNMDVDNEVMDATAPVSLLVQPQVPRTDSSSTLSEDDASDRILLEEQQVEDAMDIMEATEQEQQPQEQEPNGTRKPRSMFQRMNSGSSGSVKAASSQNSSSRDWGWFDEEHNSTPAVAKDDEANKHPNTTAAPAQLSSNESLLPVKSGDAAAAAMTAPTYVLEESLSSQRLWKDTAGQRPPQPVEERCFYEKMWAQNFARSEVEYQMPVEVLTATSPISMSPFADGYAKDAYTHYNLPNADHTEAALVSRMQHPSQVVNKKSGDLTVLVRGDNVFGTTVSKSFVRPEGIGVDTVNISIASYRVVQDDHGKYAQFLVIYREGSIRDTIGIWKRYSDFEELARKVTTAHEGCAAVIANISPLSVTQDSELEHLPNAITSWRLLKKRQRWFRCLDAGYLSLKVFLLERFLHDILFESSSPNLLRDFVGADSTLMLSE